MMVLERLFVRAVACLLFVCSSRSTGVASSMVECKYDDCHISLDITEMKDEGETIDPFNDNIFMKMCNNHKDKPLIRNSLSTFFAIEEKKTGIRRLPNPFLFLPLQAGHCTEMKILVQKDTYESGIIQVDGHLNLNSDTTQRCYCHLSVSRQEDISACDLEDIKSLKITEIADPRHDRDRFIEIYSEKCKNKVILDDIKVERVHREGEYNETGVRAMSLQSLKFDKKGYIVISSTEENALSTFHIDRDYTMVLPAFFFGNTFGKDFFRIVQYDASNKIVIEEFQVVEEDFTKGRAVRNCDSEGAASWTLQYGNVEDCDPFYWYCAPTEEPSLSPSQDPSTSPTSLPSLLPTTSPSSNPSSEPSLLPSNSPSQLPSFSPSISPTIIPSVSASEAPSNSPTRELSEYPSDSPSDHPSQEPTCYKNKDKYCDKD